MKTDYINIDKINKTPIYLFDSNPKILLMAGIHGNEKTGVVILQKIIEQLQKNNKAYSVAIIPCVNLPAYLNNSRVNPNDLIDLNRVFPVHKIKSQSYETAKAVQDFAQKFSIVVDIHVFTGQHALVCGVDLKITKNKIDTKIKKIMSQIGLKNICRIDHTNEPQKDGSLCSYLQHKNIVAFGIELPPLEVFRKNDLENIINNLNNLISQKYKVIKPTKTFLYKRLQFFSEIDGVFTPQKNIGEMIKKYDEMGFLKEKNKIFHIINSKVNGRLISISYKKFVKKGDKLFVIGKDIKN